MVTKQQLKKMTAAKTPKPSLPKFQGKGTRARLNTAAEKNFFNSKASK